MSKTLRILFLEETPEEAELAIATLEDAGYTCEWARVDTREAFLQSLESPEYGLVISDYKLPAFDGLSAVKLLVDSGLEIPFILISDPLGEEAAIEGLKAGASDVVLKDKLHRLPVVVERALKEKEEIRLAKLAEQQSRLQAAALESAANGIVITDPNGIIVFVNPAFTKLTGYTANEVLHQNPRLLKSGAHNDPFYEDLWNTVLSGRVWHGEMVNRRKDGSTYTEEQTITPVTNDLGEIINFIAIKQDITESKLKHKALIESEERYRDLVENALDIIYTHDLDGNYTSANRAVENILGYTVAEAVTKNLATTVAPEYLDIAKEMTSDLLNGADAVSAELEVIAKKGHRVAIEVKSKLVKENGLPVGIQGIARDITERKRNEEALGESQRLIEGIINAMPMAVFWKDKDLVFLGCNSQFARDAGFADPKDIIGKDDFQMAWRDQAEVYQADDRRVIEEGTPRLLIEEPQTTPEGNTITLLTSKIPMLNSAGETSGVLGTYLDITERKQLEEQYRQAQKMEAIGLLAGGVAHDFNNLLTAITGYSDLSLRKISLDDPLRGNIEEIRKAADRAAALTSQLLAFSRKQIINPRVHNINSVIADIDKMLRRLLKENIQLNVILDPELGNIKADPGQIEQVVINLAINAHDAMPNGGSLTIETKTVYLDKNYTDIHITASTGPHVRIALTDTGHGMTSDIQRRIFEPFFTTKAVGKGTGLGLSTVHGIVKQGGGSIQVYSEPGHGTTFKIYLPCVDESVERLKWIDDVTDYSGTETILLVEDDDLVRDLVREILTSNGYTVLEAGSGEAALSICETHLEPIHLLLTDVIMPGISGPAVKNQIVELFPDIKVLFMSGYTDDAITQNGLLDIGNTFIEKPFTPDALARKIREVLTNAS